MRIECVTTFSHAGKTYQKGQQYDVPEQLGRYFVAAAGWARDCDGGVMRADLDRDKRVALEVDNLINHQPVRTR